jgi:putative transposase
MSRAARLSMIDSKHPELPIVRQCVLLNVARSTVYYKPAPESAENLLIMRIMDEQYLRTPYYGARKFVEWLLRQGHIVNRKRVKRLMRLMGIEAIYQKPNTSKKNPENKIYPYLLRDVTIDRVNQVWCTDITYIRMPKGFLYLVVVMDWVSRKALSWRLSNTMDADFCVEALEEALARYGRPEIFNTDQGSQFTSSDFTGVLLREGIAISMDGKGRFMDNIFIERLWRSLKYEEVFIKSWRQGAALATILFTIIPKGYTRRWTITHQMKFLMREQACGYVDNRLRRPVPLPPCSPRPLWRWKAQGMGTWGNAHL